MKKFQVAITFFFFFVINCFNSNRTRTTNFSNWTAFWSASSTFQNLNQRGIIGYTYEIDFFLNNFWRNLKKFQVIVFSFVIVLIQFVDGASESRASIIRPKGGKIWNVWNLMIYDRRWRERVTYKNCIFDSRSNLNIFPQLWKKKFQHFHFSFIIIIIFFSSSSMEWNR